MVRNFFGQRDEDAPAQAGQQVTDSPMPVDTTRDTDPLPALEKVIPVAVPAPLASLPEKSAVKLVFSDQLPAGFSGKIRGKVRLTDPETKAQVTFKTGDERKLFAFLVKHREAMPVAIDELAKMKAVSGDWKLQFAKVVKS